jgi:hypothetical protein
MSIGSQLAWKGFEFFSDIWCGSGEIRERFLFCAVGQIASSNYEAKYRFLASGGFVLDRYLTDGEILDAYGTADLVWACYPPHYDQASGIFGRSVQLGRSTIVRQESFIAALSAVYGHPHVAVPFQNAEAARRLLLAWRPDACSEINAKARAASARTRSLEVLNKALFGAHST